MGIRLSATDRVEKLESTERANNTLLDLISWDLLDDKKNIKQPLTNLLKAFSINQFNFGPQFFF